jgi:hypothetical protein
MGSDEFLDPYALFGLNEHYANISEARKSYYALALDTHPDKFAGNAAQFRVVHTAWKWIEKQLAGVPSAEDVVARFETQKREWAEFLEAQRAKEPSLPDLRDIVGEFGAEGTLPDAVHIISRPQETEFLRRFNARWESNCNDATAWKPFPRGGYGTFVTESETSDIKPFPARELVIYEAPTLTLDRATVRYPAPTGVVDDLEDYGVPEAVPFGCDYAAALSAPLTLLDDSREKRTLEEFEVERAAVDAKFAESRLAFDIRRPAMVSEASGRPPPKPETQRFASMEEATEYLRNHYDSDGYSYSYSLSSDVSDSENDDNEDEDDWEEDVDESSDKENQGS